MSIKDLRHEFEHQLKVAQDIMRRDYDLLHHPDMADPVPEVRESEKLEGRPMAAPSAIKGLPGKLRDQLAKLTARVQTTVDDVEKAVTNFHARLDDVDKAKGEINSAAAEIQEITGMDNGGPEK